MLRVMRRQDLSAWLYVTPLMLVLVPFFLLPTLVVLVASFYETDGFGGLLPTFTLANYVDVLTSAQTFQAQITGVVRDPSGARIANARVVATNIATAVSYSTESNVQGIYRLMALPPGQYKVSTSISGFKTSEQGPVTNVDIR